MSEIINVIGLQNFENEVLKSETPILVDFWAPWCGPCLMMAPVLEEIAKDYDGKIKVVKVDTEQSDNFSLAQDYQIFSIPNMKLFKKGEVVKEFVGFRPKEILLQELKEVLV